MKTLHNYLVQLNIHLINQRLKQRSLDKFLCKKIHYWIHTFFKTNTCNACSKELLFSLPRSYIGNAQGHLDHSKLQVYLINLFLRTPPPNNYLQHRHCWSFYHMRAHFWHRCCHRRRGRQPLLPRPESIRKYDRTFLHVSCWQNYRRSTSKDLFKD